MALRLLVGGSMAWPTLLHRRAVIDSALQVRYPACLTDEEYVSQQVWNGITVPDCPHGPRAPHPAPLSDGN